MPCPLELDQKPWLLRTGRMVNLAVSEAGSVQQQRKFGFCERLLVAVLVTHFFFYIFEKVSI